MSFGQNLQLLRKMQNKMTQEELAEKLGVSRQTVSKWEGDMAYPEMDKVIELCTLFSCSMDQLMREDMNVYSEAYSNIRVEWVEPFHYIQYAVISREPETDAINHVKDWAEQLAMTSPGIIGWDFPMASQEQINVFHFHGYTAALMVEKTAVLPTEDVEVLFQQRQRYIAITIKQPSLGPFRLIPDAYKTLITYMKTNGIRHKNDKQTISCFEKEYSLNGIDFMDVYIAID